MLIKLYKGGASIGYVSFEGDSENPAYSEVVAVATLLGNKGLEVEINQWLQSNPEGLILFGGAITEGIGHHGDGVLAVLHTLGERRGFTFDRALIPMPEFESGSVG